MTDPLFATFAAGYAAALAGKRVETAFTEWRDDNPAPVLTAADRALLDRLHDAHARTLAAYDDTGRAGC